MFPKTSSRETHTLGPAVTLATLAAVWLLPLCADAQQPADPPGDSAAAEAGTNEQDSAAAGPAHKEEEHESHEEHAGEHEHEHEAAEAGAAGRVISYLGKFHPPMVNFPIAMLIGAALAELLFMTSGRAFFAHSARYCVWIGALGAVLGATLGWFFGGFHLWDDEWIMTVHRWLGTTTAAWSVLVLFLSERANRSENPNRKPYRVTLFIGALLVSVTGFFGGAMLYGIDHYTW